MTLPFSIPEISWETRIQELRVELSLLSQHHLLSASTQYRSRHIPSSVMRRVFIAFHFLMPWVKLGFLDLNQFSTLAVKDDRMGGGLKMGECLHSFFL